MEAAEGAIASGSVASANSRFIIRNSEVPSPSLALFEPEIPANAGNIARLCAATGVSLDLIGRLGFSFRHPAARRAGMDYWELIEYRRHLNYGEFREATAERRVVAFSTRAETLLWDAVFQPGDILLFGPESRGLPEDILRSADLALRIPMAPGVRSLNVASAAAISLYEALRQLGWRPSASSLSLG
jgi:tRNA (cytidine/uridine-2'-O-)-methyltransferase